MSTATTASATTAPTSSSTSRTTPTRTADRQPRPAGPCFVCNISQARWTTRTPAVTETLGDGREDIMFDSAGVGRSTGKVPATVAGMAAHALQFLDGLCLTAATFSDTRSVDGRPAEALTAPRASIG